MAFFDQLGQRLTQTSQGAVKRTKDMAETVRLNNAITDEGKKIEAAYRELGRLYYERFADACDPALQAPVAEIRRAEASIREMKETVNRLKGVLVCPACGNEMPAGSAFCNSCGAKLPEPPKPAGGFCPACGTPADEGTVFCTNCGTRLPEPAPAPIPEPAPALVPEPVPVPEAILAPEPVPAPETVPAPEMAAGQPAPPQA